jgi:hypothetical protein
MRQLAVQEQFVHLQTVLGENIKLALWPWNPGEIKVYRMDGIFRPQFVIKVERFPDLVYRTEINPFLDATQILFDLADKAFYFYRERQSLPIDDHIILGEE